MAGQTQRFWLHQVPKMAATVAPRIAIKVVFGHALGDEQVRGFWGEAQQIQEKRI